MFYILTEERHSIILDTLKQQGSIKLAELCSTMNISESTVRRDLYLLDKRGLLKKVHGGAVAVSDNYFHHEYDMEEKATLNTEEKLAIAKYAASLIEDNDFVYIDAGTTTEKMISFINAKNITFVTNGFSIAKELAKKGFSVHVPAGEVKATTEAIIGAECVLSLQTYSFTKCFLGVNGISISSGLTTPTKNEATIKSTAIARSKDIYVLADHSKFDKYTAVTFGELNKVTIITDTLQEKKYLSKTKVLEVI
ncbi:MAG: DeoR/GlpR family DNA-binding transcription regulator [Anaerotignaceae bacterium]